MARPAGKLLGVLALLLLGLALAALVFTSSRPPAASSPLPSPNGYDDLIKAGGIIDRSDYSLMSQAEIEALVRTNAEALKLARTGLSRECRVPLNYSPTDADAAHIQGLGGA